MSEYESMTKVVSPKGHADGLKNMLSTNQRQISECGCVLGACPHAACAAAVYWS